jgi:hypothetical protein
LSRYFSKPVVFPWFSSIKFITISNKIAQSLDLKNNKIINAILNKFFINEWNKNKEKYHTSFASILSNEKFLQFSLIMDIKASLS